MKQIHVRIDCKEKYCPGPEKDEITPSHQSTSDARCRVQWTRRLLRRGRAIPIQSGLEVSNHRNRRRAVP